MANNCNIDYKDICDVPHAVIDKHFVDGKDQTRKFPGYYVSVREEAGAVYHVSRPGPNCLSSAVLVSAGVMFIDGYNPNTRPFKSATVYDFLNNKAYIFDPKGDFRTITLGVS